MVEVVGSDSGEIATFRDRVGSSSKDAQATATIEPSPTPSAQYGPRGSYGGSHSIGRWRMVATLPAM
jgi:hypothetical protein